MLLSYSLISAFILGFGYLAYIFTTSGERQHAFNRIFILTIYGMALLLPFLILSLMLRQVPDISDGGVVEIGPLTGAVAEPATDMTASGDSSGSMGRFLSLNLTRILYRIYIVGVVLTLIHTVVGWMWLLHTIRKGEKVEFDGFTLILTDDASVSPFSWRNTIVMRRSDYKDARDMIMMHELAHLRLSHWTDLLVAQCAICLQWFNPAAWALREELKAVHEYQADEAVIASGADMKQYQMLLIRKAVGFRFQPLANSLNHSKLKKRVTMMYKKKSSSKRRFAAVLLVPALIAGCAVTAIPSVAGVIESFADTTSETTVDLPEVAAPVGEVTESSENEIYQVVDSMAQFPGGQKALINYLMENIVYPEESYKNDEQGRAIVRFVIEADGSVKNAEIIKGITPLLDKEAVRVIESMPKWQPGKVGGKPVASYFNLPVTFRIKETKETDK